MSEFVGEKTKIFVRYVWYENKDSALKDEIYYLSGDLVGWTRKEGKQRPKRAWDVFKDIDDAFDFLKEYGSQEKALAMAKRLGKIVDAGRGLLSENAEMEIVMVHEVTTRKVTCIHPANPLVVLALQAED